MPSENLGGLKRSPGASAVINFSPEVQGGHKNYPSSQSNESRRGLVLSLHLDWAALFHRTE